MNIVCVICSDLLLPSDDIFNTPCGHIFHLPCLAEWLKRSKTCPQCREKTNENKIHRVYFNFSNDSIVEDSSSLQDKIDKLTFQILLKDNDLKRYIEKSDTMEKQNDGLRRELKKTESRIREKETAIHALKDQVKYFRQQCSEVDAAKEENVRLKKKVQDLKNIQVLMDGPAEVVDDMVSSTNDPSTLITYISIMKREMSKCVSKRREMRAKLQSVQQELTKVSMERNYLLQEQEKRKRLEQELMACEKEKMILQNKMINMKCNQSVGTHSRNNAKEKQMCSSSPKAPKEERKAKPTEQTIVNKDVRSSQQRTRHVLDTEISSPNIPLQSQGILAIREQYIARRGCKTGFSILAKRPRLSENTAEPIKSGMIAYDGFGGHSKYDKFPSPVLNAKLKKTKECPLKTKKIKLDTGDNKKLSDLIMDIS